MNRREIVLNQVSRCFGHCDPKKIAQYTEYELLKTAPMIGRKSVNVIIEWLAEYGLVLAQPKVYVDPDYYDESSEPEDIRLNHNVRRYLRNALGGKITPQRIAEVGYADLRRQPMIGAAAMANIAKWLGYHGLSYSGDIPRKARSLQGDLRLTMRALKIAKKLIDRNMSKEFYDILEELGED